MTSQITVSQSAITYEGPDAIQMFRVSQIRMALRGLKIGLMPTRGVGKRRVLDMAGEISGKHYKLNQLDVAISDMSSWIEAAKAAMPIVNKS